MRAHSKFMQSVPKYMMQIWLSLLEDSLVIHTFMLDTVTSSQVTWKFTLYSESRVYRPRATCGLTLNEPLKLNTQLFVSDGLDSWYRLLGSCQTNSEILAELAQLGTCLNALIVQTVLGPHCSYQYQQNKLLQKVLKHSFYNLTGAFKIGQVLTLGCFENNRVCVPTWLPTYDWQLIKPLELKMGQIAPMEHSQLSLKEFIQRCEIEKEFPELNCKVLKERKSKRHFMLKESILTTNSEVNELTARLKARKLIKHEHYLPLEDYFVRSEWMYCSTFKLGAVYQLAEQSLRDEVAARIQEGKVFSEKEIWSILCVCSMVVGHLERSGVTYNTITPQDIFLTEDGVVKLVDPDICDLTQANDPRPYYAPEFLSSHREAPNGVVFSLGMCALQVIFMEPLFDCYDYDEYAFNGSMFNVRMVELDKLNNISDNLKGVLSKILKSSDRQRPTVTQLQEMLYKLGDEAFGQSLADSVKPSKQSLAQPTETLLKTVIAIPLLPEHEEFSEPVPEKVLVDLENVDEADDKVEGVLTERSQNILSSSNSNMAMTKNRNTKSDGFQQQDKENISAKYSFKKHAENSQNNLTSLNNLSNVNGQVIIQSISQGPPVMRVSNQLNQDLYTDPKLLAQVKQDLQDIHTRKSMCAMSQQKMQQVLAVNPSVPTPKITYIQKPLQQTTSVPAYSTFIPVNFQNPSAKVQNQLRFVTEIYNKGRYEGQKKNGVRHGYGTFYYEQGGKYIGQWRDNRMDGKGILYYYNEKVAYEGEWKEDRLWGYGILYNEEPKTIMHAFDYSNFDEIDEFWLRYEGNFVDDNKAGQGTLYLTNGERFEGQFKQDAVHGEGLFYTKDGRVIQGVWSENLLTKKY